MTRVLALFLLIALALYAQTAIVSGTILRAGGNPAFNVTVTIGQQHRLTDVRGRYRISGVPFGRQTFEVSEGKRILMSDFVDVNGASVVHNEKLK